MFVSENPSEGISAHLPEGTCVFYNPFMYGVSAARKEGRQKEEQLGWQSCQCFSLHLEGNLSAT